MSQHYTKKPMSESRRCAEMLGKMLERREKRLTFTGEFSCFGVVEIISKEVKEVYSNYYVALEAAKKYNFAKVVMLRSVQQQNY